MTSFTARYADGECEAVWNELRALGPVPETLSEDVSAVAAETMRRVAVHAERLAWAYLELGFTGSELLYPPPNAARLADLDRLAAEIGGLPYALDACLRTLNVFFGDGDCEPLALWGRDMERGRTIPVLPDPLTTPPVSMLAAFWEGYNDDYGDHYDEDLYGERPPFSFSFAPDEIAKANYSGGHHTIELPSTVADPVLVGVSDRPGITLVEYLRLSIAWAGLPGWARTEEKPPEALTKLRVTPDF